MTALYIAAGIIAYLAISYRIATGIGRVAQGPRIRNERGEGGQGNQQEHGATE